MDVGLTYLGFFCRALFECLGREFWFTPLDMRVCRKVCVGEQINFFCMYLFIYLGDFL